MSRRRDRIEARRSRARDPSARGRSTSVLAVAALAGVSTLVALGLAELGLRLFRPVDFLAPPKELGEEEWKSLLHQSSPVPGLAYELAPRRELEHQGVPVVTNRHGMRDREPSPVGTPGLFRIAVLGDSVTFGYGVRAEEAWPDVLEELLAESAGDGEPRYETLNFAVAGYSIHDETRVLEHKALAWDPDLVLVGYSLNDAETQPIQPLHQHFHDPLWWQHFHLPRLVAQWRREREEERYGGYVRRLYAPDSESWRGVVAGFERMAELTRPRDVPVLVVVFPSLKKLRRGLSDADLHAQVAEAARGAGLHVLDLLPVLAPIPPRRLHLPRDVLHPTPFGHRVAAIVVHDGLRANPSLLGPPRARPPLGSSARRRAPDAGSSARGTGPP